MTKKRKLTQEELDRRHEAQFEKAFDKLNREHGDEIHFNMPLEDNVSLRVFNQVLREQAHRKVN